MLVQVVAVDGGMLSRAERVRPGLASSEIIFPYMSVSHHQMNQNAVF